MKIYFVGSIKGKSKYLDNYKAIIKVLKDQGVSLICQDVLNTTEEIVSSLSDERKVKHYKNVLKWINSADVVVTEISYPSINIGHEISLALEKGKPVVALYTGKNEPHLLQGLISEKLIILNYNFNDLKEVLKDGLKDARGQMDIRFTMLLSPKIVNFLNKISKKKNTPKSVFIRSLIEKEMEKEK